MRRHAENAKAEEMTTEPENEVRQDATTSGPEQTESPAKPVDLKAGPYEYKAGQAEPEKLQHKPVSELVQDCVALAIEQAADKQNSDFGLALNQLIQVEERLAALEAAVRQNSKQTRALTVKITDFILLKRLTKEEQEG